MFQKLGGNNVEKISLFIWKNKWNLEKPKLLWIFGFEWHFCATNQWVLFYFLRFSFLFWQKLGFWACTLWIQKSSLLFLLQVKWSTLIDPEKMKLIKIANCCSYISEKTPAMTSDSHFLEGVECPCAALQIATQTPEGWPATPPRPADTRCSVSVAPKAAILRMVTSATYSSSCKWCLLIASNLGNIYLFMYF